MLSFVLISGSLALVAAVEFCYPRRRREYPALRRRLGNVGFWLANLVLVALLLSSPAAVRHHLTTPVAAGLPSWPIAHAGLSFVAGFLLLDLLRYAVHRCE